MIKGYLYLEDGTSFAGEWLGGEPRAAEVIFNTSHNGFEEIATDPSYFGQMMVMTAPMQGNYGVDEAFWESSRYWFEGFIAVEIEQKDQRWLEKLIENKIPVIQSIDTRQLVLHLRDKGTQVGALVKASSEAEAKAIAIPLIAKHKTLDKDWCHHVCTQDVKILSGASSSGPRVAIIDYGCKQNIVRELLKRCREVAVFPSRSTVAQIAQWNPHGILLSNGPGDPAEVQVTVDTVKQFLGKKVIFGICMGHQILARALGAKTYRLKFGHHGANHPVKDLRSGQIYVTSQNHGYAIDSSTLPREVEVTHMNLNDKTISGIQSEKLKCFSVQFHPESHPGPRDADLLFNEFIERIHHEL